MASLSVYQKVLALCERRGFIYNLSNKLSGSDLSLGYFYGPLGAELKRNILNEWWYAMVTSTGYVHPMCNPTITWNSSESKSDKGADHSDTVGVQLLRQSLLTPEAFKKMASTQLPYGMAEIGKVFRKLPDSSRLQECEVADMKLFSSPENHQQLFTKWQRKRLRWWKKFAVNPEDFSLENGRIGDKNSERLMDIQYKNLHGRYTLEVFTNPFQTSTPSDKLSPCSFSTQIDQAVLAYIFDAYSENVRPYATETSDKHTILRFHLCLAPYKAAVLTEDSADPRLHIYLRKLAEELRISGMTVAPCPVSDSCVEQLLLHDEIGTPYRIFGNSNTLKTGIVSLENRDATIKEEINAKHVLTVLQQMIKGASIN